MSTAISLRVLVAHSDPAARFRLRAQLDALNHRIVAEATNDRELVALIAQPSFDLIILEAGLYVHYSEAGPAMSQPGSAMGLTCPTIVLNPLYPPEQEQTIAILAPYVFSALPADERDLRAVIEQAMNQFQQTAKMETRYGHPSVSSNTQTRIVVATTCLMKKHHFSPQKAQEWLWQEAMAKKASLNEVADAVLNNKTVNYHYSVPI